MAKGLEVRGAGQAGWLFADFLFCDLEGEIEEFLAGGQWESLQKIYRMGRGCADAGAEGQAVGAVVLVMPAMELVMWMPAVVGRGLCRQ